MAGNKRWDNDDDDDGYDVFWNVDVDVDVEAAAAAVEEAETAETAEHSLCGSSSSGSNSAQHSRGQATLGILARAVPGHRRWVRRRRGGEEVGEGEQM